MYKTDCLHPSLAISDMQADARTEGQLQAYTSIQTKINVHFIYEGYPESNLRFGIKKTQVKGNIFYYIHLKATIWNYFST